MLKMINLKELLKVDKRKSRIYVLYLVKPDKNDLEKIKDLPFDYYQIYDCSPEEINLLKKNIIKKLLLS